MKNFITANGFQGHTLDEYLEIYKNIFRTSFNNQNLDFSSNAPFGNVVNILSQFAYDTQLNLQDCYNLVLSIDTATGINLDYLGSFSNIARKGGSYTLQEIDITTTALVFLQGLDGNVNNSAFLVGDGNGNNFALVNSTAIAVGTTTLLFQAQTFGAINVMPNTITTLITILNGITACNNPQPALSIGNEEETDGAYRVRLKQSQAINSVGFIDSLRAKLLNLSGVSNAIVLHNPNNIIDNNNIPPHSIWIIMEGGTDADIANAVFLGGGFGCGMKGTQTVDVLQADGRNFVVKFDRALTATLYVKFNLKNNTLTPIDLNSFKTEFVANISFILNEIADSGKLTFTAVQVLQTLGYNASVSGLQVSSDNINYVDYLETPSVANKWGLSSSNVFIILI